MARSNSYRSAVMPVLSYLALLGWPGAALAQPAAYSPDIASLDGTQSMAIEPDNIYRVDGDATIEFWVAPGWTETPNYDPVVVSNLGETGVNYIIAVLRERDGIGVLSGDTETLAPFDFTDDRLHHVAIVQLDGALNIVIDGAVRGVSETGFAASDVNSLWLGTANGEAAPFIGDVAQLRFWSAAVGLDTLEQFKLANPLSEDAPAHPDLESLVAFSAFPDASLLVRSFDDQ